MKVRDYNKGDPRIKSSLKRLTDIGLYVTVEHGAHKTKFTIKNKYLSEKQTRLLLHLNFGEDGREE